jgi:cation diffusion facilitator family transporter
MQPHHRYNAVKKITIVGAISNALLAIIKIIFGFLGQSHALFADGVHSVADLLTDALVLIASKVGSKLADYDHPYGHQRIETAATVALALLLILAGAGIMYDAGIHIIQGSVERPKFYVLLVALISIAANEGLFHFTLRVANKTKSQLLTANAWHHRSDAAASLVVLLGAGGALLGYTYLDALAAVIVGAMIIKMGGNLSWSCLRELVDTAPDLEIITRIQQVILSVSGVCMIHQLRTRLMGDDILVDVHVLVPPNLSVSEGHYIATRVHHTLLKEVVRVRDVTVHIDAENDEVAPPTENLPDRAELMPQLLQCWRFCPGSDRIQKINLHYLSGKIHVEVHLPVNILVSNLDATTVQSCYNKAVTDLLNIEQVDVLFGL